MEYVVYIKHGHKRMANEREIRYAKNAHGMRF